MILESCLISWSLRKSCAEHSPDGSIALNLRVLSTLPFLTVKLIFLLQRTTSNNSHSRLWISKSPTSRGIICRRTSLFLKGSSSTLGEFYRYFNPSLQITLIFFTAIGIWSGFWRNILKVIGELMKTRLCFLLKSSFLSPIESES